MTMLFWICIWTWKRCAHWQCEITITLCVWMLWLCTFYMYICTPTIMICSKLEHHHHIQFVAKWPQDGYFIYLGVVCCGDENTFVMIPKLLRRWNYLKMKSLIRWIQCIWLDTLVCKNTYFQICPLSINGNCNRLRVKFTYQFSASALHKTSLPSVTNFIENNQPQHLLRNILVAKGIQARLSGSFWSHSCHSFNLTHKLCSFTVKQQTPLGAIQNTEG